MIKTFKTHFFDKRTEATIIGSELTLFPTIPMAGNAEVQQAVDVDMEAMMAEMAATPDLKVDAVKDGLGPKINDLLGNKLNA